MRSEACLHYALAEMFMLASHCNRTNKWVEPWVEGRRWGETPMVIPRVDPLLRQQVCYKANLVLISQTFLPFCPAKQKINSPKLACPSWLSQFSFLGNLGLPALECHWPWWVWALPHQSQTKKMPCGLAYRKIGWRHFPKWGYLFPEDPRLCLDTIVDRKPN